MKAQREHNRVLTFFLCSDKPEITHRKQRSTQRWDGTHRDPFGRRASVSALFCWRWRWQWVQCVMDSKMRVTFSAKLLFQRNRKLLLECSWQSFPSHGHLAFFLGRAVATGSLVESCTCRRRMGGGAWHWGGGLMQGASAGWWAWASCNMTTASCGHSATITILEPEQSTNQKPGTTVCCVL